MHCNSTIVLLFQDVLARSSWMATLSGSGDQGETVGAKPARIKARARRVSGCSLTQPRIYKLTRKPADFYLRVTGGYSEHGTKLDASPTYSVPVRDPTWKADARCVTARFYSVEIRPLVPRGGWKALSRTRDESITAADARLFVVAQSKLIWTTKIIKASRHAVAKCFCLGKYWKFDWELRTDFL